MLREDNESIFYKLLEIEKKRVNEYLNKVIDSKEDGIES